MSNRVEFHLDENMPRAIAKALRQRGVDVTTTVDAGLRQKDDLAQLGISEKIIL